LINVPVGGRQEAAIGTASYPFELNKTEKPTVVYRDETNSHAPTPPCVGSVNEPHAEPGFLCFYRGGNFGFLEKEDTGVFDDFYTPEGGKQATATSKEGARSGALIVFTTKEFEEEFPIEAIKESSYVSAAGSWSVTSK